MSSSVLPIFSSKSVIVSGLIFRSLIQFEFIVVYSVRKYYNFILLHIAVQGSNGETDIENRLMGLGEGEIYGKSNMEAYITICKTESQREFAVWLRKLKQGLCINLEGWVGKGHRREVQK